VTVKNYREEFNEKASFLLIMMVSAVSVSYASEESMAFNQHVGPYADIMWVEICIYQH